MTVKEIQPITDHAAQGIARLRQLYKDATPKFSVGWSADLVSGWEATLHALISPAQTLENIMNQMLAQRGLETSEGINLDRIGQIVGAEREGRNDEDYRTAIVAQIAANNSDTTGDNLVNIAAILLGESLQSVGITENYPAKAKIDFSVEDQYTIDSTNNTIGFEEEYDSSGIVNVTLPEGDYFPPDLAALLEQSFQDALGYDLTVSFQGDRTYIVFVDQVQGPSRPAIYWLTSGPLWGFVANTVTVHTVKGSPVTSPGLSNDSIQITLDAAKAAGVKIDTAQFAYNFYFGFSIDPQALPFGVIVGWYMETFYSDWVTPTTPTSAYEIAGATLDQFNFSWALSDGDGFYTEFIAYLVGSQGVGRYFALRDSNGDQFEFEVLVDDLTVNLTTGSNYYTMSIDLQNGDIDSLRVTRNRFTDIALADLDTEFGIFLHDDIDDFNFENPEGICQTLSSLVRGGGVYSLITS